MSHNFAHFMNRFRQNTDLRNCLPEIKDVAKAEAHACKERRGACLEIQKWAQGQDENIAKFLLDMCQAEESLNTNTAVFNDVYLDFYHVWKELLGEQTELIERESEYTKAKEKLAKAEETLQKEEQREEQKSGDVTMARAKVAAQEVMADAAQEEFKRKLLEVQRDMFQKLRDAYFKLHTARMQLLKATANDSEKAFASMKAFPTVVGLAEDGRLLTDVYHAPLSENYEPVWHHGDELYAELLTMRPFKPKYEEASVQVTAFEQHKRECAQTMADLAQRHSDELSAASQQTALELQRKEDMIAAQIGRTALVDASGALTDDVADVLVARARQAQTALRALGVAPLSTVEFSRQIISCVYECVAALNSFGDETRFKLKGVVDRIIANSNDLFAAILANGDPKAAPEAVVSGLFEDLSSLALLAESLQIKEELPADVAHNISSAQAAIREALKVVENYREESKQREKGTTLALDQELLTEGMDMLTAAREIVDSATSMQDGLRKSSDHATIRKWMMVMSAAVDTLLIGVPQWLGLLQSLLRGKGKIEDFQAVTRSISACSAQLVAFVRTQQVGQEGSASGTSSIEKSTAALQVTSHKVIATASEISRYRLSSVALEEYSKLGANEISKLVLSTQSETLRLEKALETEREKLGRLRRMQYKG